MHDNPYQTPKPSDAALIPGEGTAGLWRDGNLLVMRIRDSKFPPRCVKTNEPCKGEPTHVVVDWIPHHVMWLLMFGALGHAIAKKMFGKTISVNLPLSERWLSNRKRTSKTGWRMIIGGICCFVFGTVGYVFAMLFGLNETLSQCILFGVLVAPLIAIAGVIYMFARHNAIVTAKKMTTEHAWIKGISTDFLGSVPSWGG